MTNNVYQAMTERFASLSVTIASLEKQLSSFPEGFISVKRINGHIYYYLSKYNCQSRTLGENDSALIKLLVQKSYVTRALKAAKEEAEALQKALKKYPSTVAEDIYLKLSAGRKEFATPIFFTDEECARNWLSIPFTPKPFSKDAPEYYTAKGERVRSKSEVIIADRLFAKGIPYKYECPFLTRNGIIHPDYTILRLSDRKILYHEHCGKMGDHGYVSDMLDRVDLYAHENIYVGDRLFLTFESEDHPFDLSYLDDFIEKNYR